MDWKLLLASFVAIVLNVSAQKGGMCRYGNASYKENMRCPGCYCTCRNVNGALKVDCDTEQCKPKDQCAYNGRSYNVGDQFPAKDNCGECVCKIGSKVECNIPAQCKPTPAPYCAASSETMGSIRVSGAVWDGQHPSFRRRLGIAGQMQEVQVRKRQSHRSRSNLQMRLQRTKFRSRSIIQREMQHLRLQPERSSHLLQQPVRVHVQRPSPSTRTIRPCS